MGFFDFTSLPLWANVLIFAVGAAVVWFAGTRVSRYVDAISEKTGLGAAFAGMVLLGGITSLPEIATTVTASLSGSAPLAVNNVMGGIAMQVAILALADATTKRHALTFVAASSEVLLQGVLLVLVLVVTAVAIAVGDEAVLGFGAWTASVFVLVVLGLYLINEHEENPRWEPVEMAELQNGETGRGGSDQSARAERHSARHGALNDGDQDAEGQEASRRREDERKAHRLTRGRLIAYTVAASAAVLVAGFFVTRAAEALAEQTGLGSNLVGAVLLAISTSLPEVSTTLEAVRLGEYRLAFSNIFGTNLFDAGILFLADVCYAGPPVLNEVGTFAQVGALLGAILTAVYLAGIIERQNRTVLRMGYSSLIVLVLYLGGLVLLYNLR